MKTAIAEPTPNPSKDGSRNSDALTYGVPLLGGARGGLPALLLCAVLLAALTNPAPAQSVRIVNGRPVFDSPGGMPPGMDSPPPSSPKPDSGGKDSGGPWLPSEVTSSSVTTTNADGSTTNKS